MEGTHQRGDELGVLPPLARHHDVGRGRRARHDTPGPGRGGPEPPGGMGSEGSRRRGEGRQGREGHGVIWQAAAPALASPRTICLAQERLGRLPGAPARIVVSNAISKANAI